MYYMYNNLSNQWCTLRRTDLQPVCVCVFSFTSRWSEVTRRLELWVQVMELNEAGVFAAVEVVPAKDVRTGGVFQLRQVASDRLCLSGFSPFFYSKYRDVHVYYVSVRVPTLIWNFILYISRSEKYENT